MVELAASVEHRHDDFRSRTLLGRMLADRNATPIVLDRHGIVEVHLDADTIAKARQGLIDRVVDNFIHHVVQAAPVVGVANVHARTHAHSLQPLENLYALFVVLAGALRWLLTCGFIYVREHVKNLGLSVT